MALGAVITTTNPLNTAQEIGKQVADSKPVLAFTIQSILPKLAGSNVPRVPDIRDEEEGGAESGSVGAGESLCGYGESPHVVIAEFR